MKSILMVVTGLFFAFILWVIYVANSSAHNALLDWVRLTPYGDKMGHAGLFGMLTLLAITASGFRSLAFGNFRIYHGASWVVVFVVLEELSQIYIPSRTFDLNDLGADAVGVAAACFACFQYRRFEKFRNKEKKSHLMDG